MDAVSELQFEIQKRDQIIASLHKTNRELLDELNESKLQLQSIQSQLLRAKDKSKSHDGGYKVAQSRYWTQEEHEAFLEALERFGPKDVKAISAFVGTRNPTQVRTHAQKYFLRLDREKKKTDEVRKTQQESPAEEKPKKNSKKRPNKKAGEEDTRSPQSIAAQLAEETTEAVLAQLKNWTAAEYRTFVEGLVSCSKERDIHEKCRVISEKYLTKFSPEDIYQCYTVLQNVAKIKGEEETDDQPAPKRQSLGNAGFPTPPFSPAMMHGYSMYSPTFPVYNGFAPFGGAEANMFYPAYSPNFPMPDLRRDPFSAQKRIENGQYGEGFEEKEGSEYNTHTTTVM